MNEKILIEFERDGKLVDVSGFRSTGFEPHESGLILDEETNMFPRGFAIALRPNDAATKVAFKRVQQRLDWTRPRRFGVEATLDRKRLRISGVDTKALPAGRYRFEMRVGSLYLETRRIDLQIPAGNRVTVRLVEKPPKRRFQLNRPVADFDTHSRRIVRKSKLDGMTAEDWLIKTKHRDGRQAAMMNILAKLAAIRDGGVPLNRSVHSIFHAEMDRVYARVSAAFHQHFANMVPPDLIIHPTHKRLLSRIDVPKPDEYFLQSYREDAPTAMQAVIAIPRNPGPRTPYFADLDIDESNPNYDVTRFFMHLGDVIDPRQTDHLKLRRELARGATEDFIYYDAVKV